MPLEVFFLVKMRIVPHLDVEIQPLKKKPKKTQSKKPPSGSVVVLFGCDGDQLLGRLGDVVGALDDLLCHQLHVGRGAGLGGQRLPALRLQPVGAGGQQPQGSPHQLRFGLLGREKTDAATGRTTQAFN